MIAVFEGFLNWTLTVTDWPGERLAAAGTVMNGLLKKVPVELGTVTPLGSAMKRIWNGPLMELPLVFVIVSVPLNV